LSIGHVARGGLFLFIGSMIASTLGYIYWFSVSYLGGAQVVGIANSVLSLSAMVSGIVMLGMPTGVQRFLGKEYSRKNIESLNTFFWSSFIFVLVLCLLSALAIWTLALLNVQFLGFSEVMLLSAGFIALLGFSGIMSALFASIIRTELTAISDVISGITKLCVGVFLVYLGFGWFGAVTGSILASLSLVVLMFFFTSKELRRLGGIKINLSLKALRKSLGAGFISWLPGVVFLLGQQLSILAIFSMYGGLEAGTFFIAYAIFSLVNMLPASFVSILLPVLSGSSERGGEIAWKALKVSLALACPMAVFVALYSGLPLSLMGADYMVAVPTLSILAFSIIPLTFVSAISNFVYASGSYGKALAIGLAVNVPQVALYFWLIPLYEGFGAALSFLVGDLIGLVITICVSRLVHFRISARKVALAVVAPFSVAPLCFLIPLNWLVGGMIILLVSVFCYGRLGLVERSDLAEIARAFASEKTLAKAGERLNWLLRVIYGKQ
jgi:O-antigen/teichoic acid export membrane protein